MEDATATWSCPSFVSAPARHQLYLSGAHRDILAMVAAWRHGDRAVLMLSGPSQAGKTVLASEIAALSEGMRVGWVSLERPETDLALEVPKALGIASADPMKGLARLLAECRSARRSCLLIVDNAHLLSEASREFLEDLTAGSGLPLPIYVLLVGREAVATLLDPPTPDELRDRIGGHLKLQPFDPAETADYIAHRFHVGSCSCHGGAQPFDAGGIWLLHAASGGYPGDIDLLVQHCLSRAGTAQGGSLDKVFVHACLAELAEAGQLQHPLPDLPGDDLIADLPIDPRTAVVAEQGPDVGMAPAKRRTLRPQKRAERDEPPARGWLKPGLTGVALAALLVLSSNLMTLSEGPMDRLSEVTEEPVRDVGAEPVAAAVPDVAQLETRMEQAAPDPQDLLIRALATGNVDPEAAIPLYTQAALWGSERAAYYLGQLYETGIGVEADVNRARAWYREASQIAGAGARLRQMASAPAVPAGDDLAPPVPERQVIFASGQSELHWRGPPGPDPARYRIEFVTAGAERVQELETGLSAALIPFPVSRWRVLALHPDGTPGPASVWAVLDRGAL